MCQKNTTLSPVFTDALIFNCFAVKACPRHISKIIEGNFMKRDTLIEDYKENCRMLLKTAKVRGKTLKKTGSINSQVSSKTSRGKKDNTKRRHQRHHKRQQGEQLFPIQVVTG